MSRTVRELIRVLERASSQAKMGDLTEVFVAVEMEHARVPFAIPGEGETAAGAHYDLETDRVVIDIESEPA